MFVDIFDLTSWFVTQGQQEDGISFCPWNQDRWLSQQRTHQFEHVFFCWWTNLELKQLTVKVELLKPTTPKNCIFMPFYTTWQPNHTILTSSVTAILKAMINTIFIGPSLGGSEFCINGGRFFNEREYSAADWLVPLLYNYILTELIYLKSIKRIN